MLLNQEMKERTAEKLRVFQAGTRQPTRLLRNLPEYFFCSSNEVNATANTNFPRQEMAELPHRRYGRLLTADPK